MKQPFLLSNKYIVYLLISAAVLHSDTHAWLIGEPCPDNTPNQDPIELPDVYIPVDPSG